MYISEQAFGQFRLHREFAMTAHPTMNDFFNRLDHWRHFPAFSLEPRSEVLFTLFSSTPLDRK